MSRLSRAAMVKPLGKPVISKLNIGETLVINETLVEKRAQGNRLYPLLCYRYYKLNQ